MDRDAEGLFYLGGGPVAAIALGMALVPFREFTTASNFAFVFLALVIVVAEFGGRGAAVATALTSALSLDFFLTQPYSRLSIADKHDIIAFVGLTACGLVAAALAAERGERMRAQAGARKHLDLLHAALDAWDRTGASEARLMLLLRECCRVLPLAAAVLRDETGRVLASSGVGDVTRAVPGVVLAPGSHAVLESGARIELRAGNHLRGWLDVWGSGAPASAESTRLLDDLAHLLALQLAQVAR
jgi:K+-sensing histidine kinase KdpD